MKFRIDKKAILYLFTFIFFGVFYYFLPFAGDDWAWGSGLGLSRLANGFEGYNGRYLGNLLIILITRSVVAKIIICSATMLLLIFILSKIFDNLSKSKSGYENYILAFSSVLILVLPNQISFGELQPFQIFGSTIGWLSGFTNYVVPAVLILIYYYIVTSNGFDKTGIYIMLAADGIAACLCVEHYSLFCVAFSFSVIAYRYLFNKAICKKSISFLIGSIAGCLIMFTNSSYRLMQKGDVSNNQRAVGFFGSLKKYASFIFPKGTSETVIIIFEAALLIVISAVFILLAVKCFRALKRRELSGLLPVICIVVMTAPLLFTNSGKEIYIVAPRCYFLQYFMLVIYIYDKLAKKDKQRGKKFSMGIKVGFALLVMITTVLYCRLDYMGIVRDRVLDEALKKDSATVEIIEYPKSIEHIQWSSNFIDNKTYIKRYRNYKSIPKDKNVEVVKFDKL